MDNKWKYKNFEDYLHEVFQKEEPWILDDAMPDAFITWLENLDMDDWFRYGDNFRETKIK